MQAKDRKAFLEMCKLSEEEVAQAGCDVHVLASIYRHHVANESELATAGTSILETLRRAPGVHSVRMRVKSPMRLVRKIVRKKREKPSRDINMDNYHSEITDRIGIRALHLFKEEWQEVHDFIKKRWDWLETPVAYIRAGDPTSWTDQFEQSGCRVQPHPRSYRSVHYLLPTSVTKQSATVEVQVRTLIEEAWSEIDHRINYPDPTEYPAVRLFLEIFNRLAGNADEMGSFVNSLERDMSRQRQSIIGLEDERKEFFSELERILLEADLAEPQRVQLIDSLRRLQTTTGRSLNDPFAPGALPLLSPNATAPVAAVHYLAEIASTVQLSEALGRLQIPHLCEECGTVYSDGSCPVCSAEAAK